MSTHPPRLELIEGGLTSEDAAWHRFCERIGWQQIGEPTLPEDYEDRLIDAIFDSPEQNVISITGEPVRAIAPSPFPARPSLWRTVGAAVAVAAMVALAVVALSRVVGDVPPAARTVPTPAPERSPAPAEPVKGTPQGEVRRLVRATTVEPEPEVVDRAPRPSVREARSYARVDVPTRRAAERNDEAEPAVSPATEPVAAISPEADVVSPSMVTAALPVHLRVPTVDVSAQGRPLALGSVPATAWRHLAMAPSSLGADSQAVALVDVIEAGRSLQGAL